MAKPEDWTKGGGLCVGDGPHSLFAESGRARGGHRLYLVPHSNSFSFSFIFCRAKKRVCIGLAMENTFREVLAKPLALDRSFFAHAFYNS